MPTYDYECKACGHSFDVFQNMSETSLSVCPACGKRQLRRLIGGGIGVIFKGSGFYVNDSRSKSSSTTAAVTQKDGGAKTTTTTTGDTKSAGDAKPAGKESATSDSGSGKKSAAAT